MSPLETMARAMYTHGNASANDEWPYVPATMRAVFMSQARAALTALRDCGVTEGMRNPARPAGCVPGEIVRPETLFRAMLDAALEEN